MGDRLPDSGVEDVDGTGSGGRADRDLGILGTVRVRLQHGPILRQLVCEGKCVLDRSLGVVGGENDRVLREKGVQPAARLDDPGEHGVRLADRLEGGLRAVPVRMEVVVGQAEEQEVVGALADQLLGDAGGVLVPRPRPGEGRSAIGRAAGVEVAVEEFVGAPDGVAEVGRRGCPLRQPLEAELVTVAPAIDQEWGRGGPHPGIAESLEDGLGLPAEVVEVHVVDEVVHRPEEPEGAGRLERRAVLDVAALDPVVPVHPHHPVAGRARAGHHLRARHRSDRGKARDAVRHHLSARQELAEGRRDVLLDRPDEHLGMHRVDHHEDQLPLH